jgi:hypothetical protein
VGTGCLYVSDEDRHGELVEGRAYFNPKVGPLRRVASLAWKSARGLDDRPCASSKSASFAPLLSGSPDARPPDL